MPSEKDQGALQQFRAYLAQSKAAAAKGDARLARFALSQAQALAAASAYVSSQGAGELGYAGSVVLGAARVPVPGMSSALGDYLGQQASAARRESAAADAAAQRGSVRWDAFTETLTAAVVDTVPGMLRDAGSGISAVALRPTRLLPVDPLMVAYAALDHAVDIARGHASLTHAVKGALRDIRHEWEEHSPWAKPVKLAGDLIGLAGDALDGRPAAQGQLGALVAVFLAALLIGKRVDALVQRATAAVAPPPRVARAPLVPRAISAAAEPVAARVSVEPNAPSAPAVEPASPTPGAPVAVAAEPAPPPAPSKTPGIIHALGGEEEADAAAIDPAGRVVRDLEAGPRPVVDGEMKYVVGMADAAQGRGLSEIFNEAKAIARRRGATRVRMSSGTVIERTGTLMRWITRKGSGWTKVGVTETGKPVFEQVFDLDPEGGAR